MKSICLFGKDHCRYSEFTFTDKSSTFASISVGSDQNSPSLKYKGTPGSKTVVFNEDALFAYDDGTYCIHAVADAHFGYTSSHDAIKQLANTVLQKFPQNFDDLDDCFENVDMSSASLSETTLLIVVFHRKTRTGFGVSVGDSTLLCVAADKIQRLNPQSNRYINIHHTHRPIFTPAERFHFTAPANSLLLSFTDGIDECNYRNPKRSIRKKHFRKLFEKYNCSPQKYGRGLMQLALQGVSLNKGGQDNIALIISSMNANPFIPFDQLTSERR